MRAAKRSRASSPAASASATARSSATSRRPAPGRLMFAIRILGAMVDDFEQGELVPVFDEAPEVDENVIRSEADFDVQHLARELRDWTKRGRSEESFREYLREQWPLYAE